MAVFLKLPSLAFWNTKAGTAQEKVTSPVIMSPGRAWLAIRRGPEFCREKLPRGWKEGKVKTRARKSSGAGKRDRSSNTRKGKRKLWRVMSLGKMRMKSSLPKKNPGGSPTYTHLLSIAD